MVAAACKVRVRVYGNDDVFEMPRDGRSVLDGARAAGVELPSSCEAGSCSTCRARLTAGRVQLVNNLALDDDELAQGYVLACQAVPQSAELALDFDT